MTRGKIGRVVLLTWKKYDMVEVLSGPRGSDAQLDRWQVHVAGGSMLLTGATWLEEDCRQWELKMLPVEINGGGQQLVWRQWLMRRRQRGGFPVTGGHQWSGHQVRVLGAGFGAGRSQAGGRCRRAGLQSTRSSGESQSHGGGPVGVRLFVGPKDA